MLAAGGLALGLTLPELRAYRWPVTARLTSVDRCRMSTDVPPWLGGASRPC